MRILILGMDGYLGWATALRMVARGHDVVGIDNFLKRRQLRKEKVVSAFGIPAMKKRIESLKKTARNVPRFFPVSATDYPGLAAVVRRSRPQAIFNFAHVPSAPYSMGSAEKCLETWNNNTQGALNLLWAMKEHAPKSHLINLGTMGEYGTPNVPIPEGSFEVKSRDGKFRDRLPFPRQAGSFYHQTKVAITHNMALACKIWNLRGTDIMQGVIYGTSTDEITEFDSRTNFYFDESFGTVINRMLASVIVNHPLPVYGRGTMTRGILSLSDAIDCYELILKNPAGVGEHRVINQFDEAKSVISMAEDVIGVAEKNGFSPKIKFYRDPRVEMEKHLYRPESRWLKNHGYRRGSLFRESVGIMLRDLVPARPRIAKYRRAIAPKTKWR